ncbi:MAG: response regulator [Gemmataceae bacterium]|nr:response regulator [Gemmataceae bacterium]
MNESEALDLRVLVWAAGRDGALTSSILADAGFGCRNCREVPDLCAEAEKGAGCIVIASELLTQNAIDCISRIISKQPAWSDLPVILVGGDADSPTTWENSLEWLGNLSFLSRPLALPTLITTVRMALRARRKQYQVRDLLHQRMEADRRKDEYLAMLAHELRNPLAPMRSAAELLRLKRPEDGGFERARDIIARQVAHMSRLVDDLLDVARITRGRITLHKETLDVSKALGELVSMMAPMAQERLLELTTDLPASPLYIDADPARFQQMVGNALSNSFKFTPAGGRVIVSANRDGGAAEIRVRDTGVGISAEQLRNVFDLFAQTERTLDRTQGGLGIGLTVLRALAERHGGSVELSSEGEGLGAEATIRLPALPLDATPPATKTSETDGTAATKPLRVLIVDDNVDSADSLAMYLSFFSHEVMCKYDPADVLRSVEAFKPHVAVCDIGLPTMDGYELVGRLRQMPVLANCLFVAVTGYGEDNDRKRALEAGFDHHLKKPVDPQSLISILKEWNQHLGQQISV